MLIVRIDGHTTFCTCLFCKSTVPNCDTDKDGNRHIAGYICGLGENITDARNQTCRNWGYDGVEPRVVVPGIPPV